MPLQTLPHPFPPVCTFLVPMRREKPVVFFTVLYSSIWLDFTIIFILTLFAQVMVSKASVTTITVTTI